MKVRWVRILLCLGALFFLSEFFLHFFALPILEHDKIFMMTHDRYIAILALTYSVLIFLVSTDLRKYKLLFILTMIGLAVMMINAAWIAYQGGYANFFPVIALDGDLSIMGLFFYTWYALIWLTWAYKK